MLFVIPILFALSFAGLAAVIVQASLSGAEAYSRAYSEDMARQFEDIFLFIEPRRIAQLGWALAAVLFLAVFLLAGDLSTTGGWILGAVLGTAAGGLGLRTPRLLLRLLRQRRLRRFNLQLVDALVSMSNSLKAGFSIMQAIEGIVRDGEAPIAQEFDMLIRQTRLGVRFSEALGNLEQRVGSNDLTLVVLAIQTARRTGGNLTEIFEKISETIRERMRVEDRIRTLTAQGRLQGMVVGAMPLFIAGVLLVMDPDLMLPFLNSRAGVITVCVVGLLISAGGLVIRRIVRIDV